MNCRRSCLLLIGLSMIPLVLIDELAVGQVSSQRQKLTEIEKVLGPELESTSRIFRVNEDFVVKIDFDDSSHIKDMFVFHKWYLNRCANDWVPLRHSVGLTGLEYHDILSKLEIVHALGSLTEQVNVGMITNQQSSVIEEYQQAFVSRTVTRLNADPIQYLTLSFRVYFNHRIHGNLESKQNTDQFDLGKLYKLRIDGKWYYSTKREFDKAVIGARSLVIAGGPITDGFDDCP